MGIIGEVLVLLGYIFGISAVLIDFNHYIKSIIVSFVILLFGGAMLIYDITSPTIDVQRSYISNYISEKKVKLPYPMKIIITDKKAIRLGAVIYDVKNFKIEVEEVK